MVTINVSLPEELKNEAETLIDSGFYASFSDLVRDSLRHAIFRNKYDLLASEAKRELKSGKSVVLKSSKDIDNFFKKI
jgi:Arc/MetJ-type ribon-helix-helix transcriptional regulator